MGALRSKLAAVGDIDAAAKLGFATPRIAIVGGGATGALMALALARREPAASALLIDPAREVGRGLAYSTRRPEHRLNVLPGKLSAFSDAPEDFADWLAQRGAIASPASKAFVPRGMLGDYLAEHIDRFGDRVRRLDRRVVAIAETPGGVELTADDGVTIRADIVILATGHSWAAPPDVDKYIVPDASIIILGTGLSMVDRWLSLRTDGHIGVVTALSRHGLLPLSHGDRSSPLTISRIPLGRPVSEVMQWLRRLASKASDWRNAVDAIRPHAQALWQSWSNSERDRFRRHARRYWDVHRHRVAPDIGERLSTELHEGKLRIERWYEGPNAGHVFDCRGYLPNWNDLRNPLIAGLLAAGTIRPDPLGIGLDVTADCRLLNLQGHASERLYAIGPITRGRFWEIEAIPDIRVQCERLAARLTVARRPRPSGHSNDSAVVAR